jgi:hypothetical protein
LSGGQGAFGGHETSRQVLQVHGFGQVSIHSGLARLNHMLALRQHCLEDEIALVIYRCVVDSTTELETLHTGHDPISDSDIRGRQTKRIPGAVAVAGLDAGVTEPRDGGADNGPLQPIVFC